MERNAAVQVHTTVGNADVQRLHGWRSRAICCRTVTRTHVQEAPALEMNGKIMAPSPAIPGVPIMVHSGYEASAMDHTFSVDCGKRLTLKLHTEYKGLTRSKCLTSR